MGIENFFTMQSGQGGLQTGLTQSGLNAKSGANPAAGLSLNGLNFLDIIVSRLNNIAADGKTNAAQAAGTATTDANSFALNKNAAAQLEAITRKSGLTLADFLSTNPDVQAEVESFIQAVQPDTQGALTQTLGLNQQAFDDTLIPTGALTAPYATDAEAKASVSLLELLQINANAEPDQIEAISGKINALRAKIDQLLEQGESAVLTTNLTPEQITALQNAADGEWPEELNGVDVILIALVQPKNDTAADLSPQSAQDITELAGDDPALANVLMLLRPQPAKAPEASAGAPAKPDTINGQATPLMNDAEALDGYGDFSRGDDLAEGEGDLRFKSAKAGEASGKNADAGTNNAAKNADTNTAVPALPAFSAFITGEAGGSLFGLPADTLGYYDDLAASTAATGTSSSAANISLLTQAANASAAHPATQMLAFNLKKGTDLAQNKTLTLELDPPELGRVEVRMMFDKDKTMKAHVITEKPETYMMLQRDADTLQRMLEQSGLADGGLSFELAQQGFDFDGNNQRGGGHDQGGTGAGGAAEGEMELIETTLNWQIDAETGHVRYNIFA